MVLCSSMRPHQQQQLYRHARVRKGLGLGLGCVCCVCFTSPPPYCTVHKVMWCSSRLPPFISLSFSISLLLSLSLALPSISALSFGVYVAYGRCRPLAQVNFVSVSLPQIPFCGHLKKKILRRLHDDTALFDIRIGCQLSIPMPPLEKGAWGSGAQND